jgi:hypothetical protein
MLGEFYEERVCLVEDSTGSLIMLETGVVNKHGRWCQKDRMSAELGIEL